MPPTSPQHRDLHVSDMATPVSDYKNTYASGASKVGHLEDMTPRRHEESPRPFGQQNTEHPQTIHELKLKHQGNPKAGLRHVFGHSCEPRLLHDATMYILHASLVDIDHLSPCCFCRPFRSSFCFRVGPRSRAHRPAASAS